MCLTTSTVFALFFLFNLLNGTLAAPLDTHHHGCKQILERKEWYVVDISISTSINIQLLRRALTDDEKQSYIDAVKCLQTQPAHNTSRPASWTRFDEFQAHHIDIAIQVHYVVSMARILCVLPWLLTYTSGWVSPMASALREVVRDRPSRRMRLWWVATVRFCLIYDTDGADKLSSYWDWSQDADADS